MRATILLPAALVLVRAYRTILAVADNRQLRLRNPHRQQELLGGFCAPVTEGYIVFLRTPLVAVTLDQQLLAGIIGQNFADHGHIVLERRRGVRTDRGLVVIEQGIF